MARGAKKKQRDEGPAAAVYAAAAAGAPSPAGAQGSASSYARRLEDYELLLEYKQLQTQQVSGVYVAPSARSLRVWYGVIFCRSGKYRNGVFKFRMDLSQYPHRGPRIFFFTRVFNPLVHSKTGELDMSIQFPEWDRSIHFIALALAYLKAVFYNAHYWDTRSRHEPFNKEAALVWTTNKARYDALCEKCVKDSAQAVYLNQKGSSVRFTKPQHNHSLVQHRVLSNAEERGEPGFSYLEWFRDGVNNLACNLSRRLMPSAQAEEKMMREVEERRSANPSPAASPASRRGMPESAAAAAAAPATPDGRPEPVPFPDLPGGDGGGDDDGPSPSPLSSAMPSPVGDGAAASFYEAAAAPSPLGSPPPEAESAAEAAEAMEAAAAALEAHPAD